MYFFLFIMYLIERNKNLHLFTDSLIVLVATVFLLIKLIVIIIGMAINYYSFVTFAVNFLKIICKVK